MDVTVGRLNAMSEMLAAQREKYLEFIRTSNQLMLKADWQSNLAKLEQMQTQHEAKLRAVEQGQQTLAQSLTHSVDTTVARLNAMNDGLVAQREKDLEYIRSSNHLILKVVVGMSGLLFLGIALLALASGRAMKKLNHTVLASPLVHAPPLLDELEDESPNARLTAGRPAQSRKLQLQRVIERLENRIAELENIGPRQLPQEAKSHDNREAREQSPLRLAEAHPTRAPSSLRSSPTGKEGAAIGFAASDVKQTGAQSKKPKLLGRMRKLLSSQPLPKTGDKK
jgi:hypothetical protein